MCGLVAAFALTRGHPEFADRRPQSGRVRGAMDDVCTDGNPALAQAIAGTGLWCGFAHLPRVVYGAVREQGMG